MDLFFIEHQIHICERIFHVNPETVTELYKYVQGTLFVEV